MKKDSMFWKDYQLSVGYKLLTMFSGPLALWISGLVYYCQSEISIWGRAPLAINGSTMLIVVLGAYFIGAMWSAMVPRWTVWILRILLPVALVLNCALLLPLNTPVPLYLFYGVVFIAHLSVIMYGSMVSHLFTVATAWQSAAFSVIIGGISHAILQNDFVYISFSIFIFISAICLVSVIGFLYIIPGKIRVPIATWKDKIKVPIIAYLGIMALIFTSSMVSVYAIHFANRYFHGLTVLFISASVFSALTLLFWWLLESKSIKGFLLYFVIIAVGIVLGFMSVDDSGLFLPACALLGCSIATAGTWTFLLSTAFSMHPTRYIGSIGVLCKCGGIAVGAFICSLFKESPATLTGIFTGAGAVLMLVYLLLHKYFYYAFESHTLGTNIRLVGQPFSLPHRVQSSRDKHPFDALSDPELMMVKMLLEGHTLFSIAFNMSIDMETAKTYRASIYNTLGIHSKAGLFRMIQKQLYEF